MSSSLLKKQLQTLFCQKKRRDTRQAETKAPVAANAATETTAKEGSRRKQASSTYKRNLSYFKASNKTSTDVDEALNKAVTTLKQGVQVKRRKLEFPTESDSEEDFDQLRHKARRACCRCQAADPNLVYEAFSRILFPSQNRSQVLSGAHLKLHKLESNRMGLICGKSGTGKTTLLQVIGGLTEPTSGSVCISKNPSATEASSPEARLAQVGMVFQFPERHFLGHTIRSELTFGWAQTVSAYQSNIQRVQSALISVGLTSFDLEMPTSNLSDGFKRRLALAVQLVRQPTVLLLDEPLAGLDWKARADMVETMERLKEKCTIVVVSHDLREVASLVDCAWKMTLGGKLESMPWPP